MHAIGLATQHGDTLAGKKDAVKSTVNGVKK